MSLVLSKLSRSSAISPEESSYPIAKRTAFTDDVLIHDLVRSPSDTFQDQQPQSLMSGGSREESKWLTYQVELQVNNRKSEESENELDEDHHEGGGNKSDNPVSVWTTVCLLWSRRPL